MAITTLESQRRNSFVLLENRPCDPPVPPPLYSQDPLTATAQAQHVPAKLNGRGILKARRSCQLRPRWESPQAIHRRRDAAAARAFLNASRGQLTPKLFTHASLFHSRTLPPLGSVAMHLDKDDEREFKIGDMVRVRRFLLKGEHASWTEWQWGQVLLNLPMRSFIGTFGRAYVVRSFSQSSGKEIIGKYAQFIGEIGKEDGSDLDQDPCVSAYACSKSRRQADRIYTRVNLPGMFHHTNIPHKDVWVPAEVLKWEDGQDIFVRVLGGPAEAQEVFVKDALPYTFETAVACRKQGLHVLGPDRKLYLEDVPNAPVKPLKNLPAMLPRSIFNLPSPSEMLARPVLRSHPSSEQ